MAKISGYNSPVDLGLGRVPQTGDPELFSEMTEVYNAIHLLAAYMDKVRAGATGGSGADPAEAMPFARFFPGVALQAITAGDLVCPSSITGENGIIKGGLAHLRTSSAPECNFVGVALADAALGELVRVGVGPAIREVPGSLSGQRIWGYAGLTTSGVKAGNGQIYTTQPGALAVPGGTAYPLVVGVCVADGFVMIGKFHKR